MDDSFIVSLYDLLWKKDTHGQILADLTGHVVALGGIDGRILIGIFLLGIFIDLIQKREDVIICGIGLTGKLSLVAVADILLCYLIASHLHDAGLYHILDIFYIDGMRGLQSTGGNHVSKRRDLILAQLMELGNLLIGLLNGIYDLRLIEDDFYAISLNDVCIDFCAHIAKPSISCV